MATKPNALGIDFSRPSAIRGTDTADQFIEKIQPQAEGILRAGQQGASRLSRQGLDAFRGEIEGFRRPEALREQAEILGAFGGGAQRKAISNIPVSAAQQEADRRESVSFNRSAAARGELGAGATILGAGQIAGQQFTGNVNRRLQELEGLAQVDRNIGSDISRSIEAAGSRQASLRQNLGSQIANVGLGLTAPVIDSIQSQAEISGLRGIARAGASAQRSSQIANLAGQVFTPQNIQSFGNLFGSSPAPAQVQLPTASMTIPAINMGN